MTSYDLFTLYHSLLLVPPSLFASLSRLIRRPVDIWAMGILLYILLSGETLWEDSSPKEVIAQVKRHEWSFDHADVWKEQPREVKQLIE